MCYNQPVVYFDSLHAKSVRTCQMLLVLPNRTEWECGRASVLKPKENTPKLSVKINASAFLPEKCQPNLNHSIKVNAICRGIRLGGGEVWSILLKLDLENTHLYVPTECVHITYTHIWIMFCVPMKHRWL